MDDSLRVEMERYLAGGMTAEETEAFLLRVQADPGALACLGRALEDQAYLFDAARPLPRRAPRVRRFRAWLSTEHRAPIGIIAAFAAAALIVVVGLALSGKPRRPAPQPEPEPVAVEPEVEPAPPAPRPVRRPPPESPRPETPRPIEPAPPSTPPPQPPPEPPKPVKPEESRVPRETKVATAEPPPVGSIEKVVGDVSPATGPVAAGIAVRTGQRSSAVVKLRRTTVEIGESTLLEDLSDGRRRFRLTEGSVAVDVTPGAHDPVLVVTRHADVTVLGTRFRLSVAADSTRLEVTQGRVRIQRLSDKASVEVKAGHYAVAGKGDLATRLLPVDDVVLHPVHGAVGGPEWRVVPDAETSSGRAFEALKTANRLPNFTGDTSRVTFTFRADAERDYHVWVRGKTLAAEKHIERDAVVIEFAQAVVIERPGPNKGNAGGGERALFNGFMHQSGYGWIGGDADGRNDEIPVVVRFARPGIQTIRLYAYETPVRIDAIWLSATQKSRPEADRR